MTQAVFEPTLHPHRRFNPLSGKHVLVSPHRTQRPWNGQTEATAVGVTDKHDPECFLCPGNKRVGGHENPKYDSTFVFKNDFSALLSEAPAEASSSSDLFQSSPVQGKCQVICFHPRHDLTLALMENEEISAVIDGWKVAYEEEGAKMGGEGYIQIFENRGAMMGASAPHPHGQIWSMTYVPDEPAAEMANMVQYSKTHQCCDGPQGADGRPHLLLDYATQEVSRKDRVVELDESGWIAVVPFWAVWPFEIMILPYKRQIHSVSSLTPEEQAGLARITKKVLVRYDNLFSTPFPYSMCVHQAPLPTDPGEDSPAQLHLHFYPPLLRSATIRKFQVGFEMSCESQRDLTPEQAATRLKEVGDVHYSQRS